MAESTAGRRVRVHLSIDDAELPAEAAAVRAALRRPAGRRRRRPTCRAPTSSSASTATATARSTSRAASPQLEADYLAAGRRPRLVYVMPGSGERDDHLALLLTPDPGRRPHLLPSRLRRRRARAARHRRRLDGAHGGLHRRSAPLRYADRRTTRTAPRPALAHPGAVAPARRPRARGGRGVPPRLRTRAAAHAHRSRRHRQEPARDRGRDPLRDGSSATARGSSTSPAYATRRSSRRPSRTRSASASRPARCRSRA